MDQKRVQPVIGRQSRWDRIKIRTAEVAVALFLASVTIQVVTFAHEQRRDSVPATKWFKVNEVFVPDHTVGQNPPVIYDRMVFEGFRGFKLAEVQRRDIDGLMFTECSGAEINEYAVEDVIPEKTVSFDWLVGRPCAVGPGTYRLRISYDLRRDGWPPKQLSVLSNVFTVTAPDASD
jgi:hypothetical protein